MRNGVSPALPRRRSTLVMRRRRRRRWPGHSSWQSRWPKAQIQVASACRNREPRLLQPRPQLGPTVTQAQLLRPQATSQCKLRLVLYNNLKVYNIVNYAIRSRISIGRCAIKILNQLKRFTNKTTFFYNSCHSMAPTARFCGPGFPPSQGMNQEEFRPGK